MSWFYSDVFALYSCIADCFRITLTCFSIEHSATQHQDMSARSCASGLKATRICRIMSFTLRRGWEFHTLLLLHCFFTFLYFLICCNSQCYRCSLIFFLCLPATDVVGCCAAISIMTGWLIFYTSSVAVNVRWCCVWWLFEKSNAVQWSFSVTFTNANSLIDVLIGEKK